MTRRSRRNHAPLRRSSTPERILSAGLATATCVGVVGLLGARTIEANTTSTASADTAVPATAPATPVVAPEPTTTSGLTQADLDAYAAQLAQEKEKLDAYRAKLIKTAKKLKRQAAAQSSGSSAPSWTPPASGGSSSSSGSASSGNSSSSSGSSNSGGSSAPAAKPAPQAKPAPPAAQAPAAPAPQPQSNTKSS